MNAGRRRTQRLRKEQRKLVDRVHALEAEYPEASGLRKGQIREELDVLRHRSDVAEALGEWAKEAEAAYAAEREAAAK